jgi:hypothetical protein
MQYVKDNNRRNPKRLLDLAREILRRKHYGIRTEEAHVGLLTTLDRRRPLCPIIAKAQDAVSLRRPRVRL